MARGDAATHGKVVVRNGFLELVEGAAYENPGLRRRSLSDSELRAPGAGRELPTVSLAPIEPLAKGACHISSDTSTVDSEGEAHAAAAAWPIAGAPREEAPEEAPKVMLVPAFYGGAPLFPVSAQAAPQYFQYGVLQQGPAPWAQTPAMRPASRSREQPRGGGATSEPSGIRTTVMLRNMPPEIDRAMLLALLDREGFAGLYDFVYLPMDFRTSVSFLYGFINFVTPVVAESFGHHFAGFNRWGVPSDRLAEVSWSDPLQGLEAHIARYRDGPLMHASVQDEYRPVLFSNGVRIPFPPPTKTIRAARKRRGKFLNTAPPSPRGWCETAAAARWGPVLA